MLHNDVLRSVRFMLDLDEAALADVVRLGGGEVTREQLSAFLKREDAPGFVSCNDAVMRCFLDGLVLHRRGPPKAGAPRRPPERRLTNNTVLKTLRVAFELKEGDLLELMRASGFEVSKPALSALFRAPGHPNYRDCGDQFLRNFLKALTARLRG